MKSVYYLASTAFVLSLMACEKEVTPDQVKETLSAGTWHVSYYSYEATPSFVLDEYDFTFQENGTLKVQGDGTDVNGIWSVGKVDGDNVLDLFAGHSSPLDELDNDWEVRSHSSKRIETENNDNGLVYLTFEKN
jgi:hypothetical protein